MKLDKVSVTLDGVRYEFPIDREVTQYDTLLLNLEETVKARKATERGEEYLAHIGHNIEDTDDIYLKRRR
jgi:hypothetical protein